MRASAPKQTDDFIKLAGPLDNANFFWLYSLKEHNHQKTTVIVWPTKCWDCDCVEDLNATVGNSFLRYFIHLSTTSLGTRSITYMNNWVSIYYKSLPILFKTRISFLLLPAIKTASSTYRIITSALLWESTLLMD